MGLREDNAQLTKQVVDLQSAARVAAVKFRSDTRTKDEQLRTLRKELQERLQELASSRSATETATAEIARLEQALSQPTKARCRIVDNQGQVIDTAAGTGRTWQMQHPVSRARNRRTLSSDIFRILFGWCDAASLAKLCLVHSTFLVLAAHVLYETIDINFEKIGLLFSNRRQSSSERVSSALSIDHIKTLKVEVSGQGQGRPQPDLTRRWPASKVPLDLDSLKLSIPSVDHCTEYLVSFLKLLDPSSLSFASFESPTGGGLKFPALSLGENALSRWTRLSSVTLGDPSTSGERRSVHFPVAGRAYYDKLPRAMIEEVPHSSTRSLVVHYFASVSPETAPADVKALCARLEKTLFRRDVTLKITFSRVQDMKAYVAAWETTTLGQMLGTGGFEVVPGLVNDVVPCVDGDTSQSATSGTTDSEDLKPAI